MDHLSAADDANHARFWASYALSPGGRSFARGGNHAYATEIPVNLFNPVILSRADGAMAAHRWMAAERKRLGGGAFWWIGHGAAGADTRRALLDLGLEEAPPTPAMHCALDRFRPLPLPPGLSISPVIGASARADWALRMSGWFGFPPALSQIVAGVEAQIPEAALAGQTRFMARPEGQPVAASCLVLSDGIAGVYAVATDPAFRGRGFGRAVTEKVMAEGLALGALRSILQSSTIGLPVYRAIGFQLAYEHVCFRQT